jgi:hypothetical protein
MTLLLVLPTVLALGASDPCVVTLPQVRPGGGPPAYPEAQRFNNQLNLAACVARHIPRAMLRDSRAQTRAQVRKACVGEAVASGSMTAAQASAIADELADQEIAALEVCRY